MLSIQVKRQSEFSVVGSTVDSTGFGVGTIASGADTDNADSM